MTIRYINVTVGAKLANGDITVTHKGAAAAQSGHVSIAYDDAVVLNMNQLRAAVAEALRQADGSSGLAKG